MNWEQDITEFMISKGWKKDKDDDNTIGFCRSQLFVFLNYLNISYLSEKICLFGGFRGFRGFVFIIL